MTPPAWQLRVVERDVLVFRVQDATDVVQLLLSPQDARQLAAELTAVAHAAETAGVPVNPRPVEKPPIGQPPSVDDSVSRTCEHPSCSAPAAVYACDPHRVPLTLTADNAVASCTDECHVLWAENELLSRTGDAEEAAPRRPSAASRANPALPVRCARACEGYTCGLPRGHEGKHRDGVFEWPGTSQPGCEGTWSVKRTSHQEASEGVSDGWEPFAATDYSVFWRRHEEQSNDDR